VCGDSGVEDEEVYRRRTSITIHNPNLWGPDTHDAPSDCGTVEETLPSRIESKSDE